MLRTFHESAAGGALALVLLLTTAGPAVAQTVQSPAGPAAALAEPRSAQETREAFWGAVRQYGDVLGRVLRTDPSLMQNAEYLAPYPAVAAFIEAYPEVTRDPEYFLGGFSQLEPPASADVAVRAQAIRTFWSLFEGVFFFVVFVMFALTLVRLVRHFLQHRKWLRLTRLQADTHNRVLERLGSNEELLTYIQSPAGSAILRGPAVVTDEPAPPSVSAPFTRILWSVQIGVVLACAGLGLLFIRRYLFEEVRDLLLTTGAMALSLGAGFALAALASYLISRRLGLLAPANRQHPAGPEEAS